MNREKGMLHSYLLPFGYLLGVLTLDFFTPLGFGDWVFNQIFFFLFFKQLDRTFVFVMAPLSSLFILLGLFWSPEGIPFVYAALNRCFAIIMVWVVGLWLLKFKTSQAALIKAREACGLSEQRLHIIFDTVAIGILEYDVNDRLTTVNDYICRILGYSRQELIGMHLDKLTAPEDRERTAGIRKELRNGIRESADYEKRYLHRDGTILWIHATINPLCDSSETYCGAVGTIYDISNRKAAEERLAETNWLLSALSEATSEPLYAKDRESRLIFLNPATARGIGKTVEELLGKNEYDWLPDRQQAEIMIANDHRVMETGVTLIVEEEMTGPQGLRHLLCTKSPLRNEAGEIIGIVGINRDITAKKEAEEELNRIKDQLEIRVAERTRELERTYEELHHEIEERLAAMEELRVKERLLIQQSRLAAMGEMISNISHQWRQPLNILGLIIQEMELSTKSAGFTPDRLKAGVTKAMQIIGEMSRTIDDFRNFFSPDKVMVSFTTREVVEKAISFMESIFKQLQVRVEVLCDEDTRVEGLRNEFTQAILNVLTNARDAFLEHGTPEPFISIHLFREKDRAVVTIEDNGGGIPEKIIDRVFEPYFTTKGPDKGTGIGLFMSKTIIEKNMGGRLTVNNIGTGALFRVEIPVG